MLDLRTPPKVITFDCYGTLVQWHRRLRDGIRSALPAPDGRGQADDEMVDGIVEDLRTISMTRQARPPYLRYEAILRGSLDEALSRKGIAASPKGGDDLLSHLRDIPPHPEVPGALELLRSRYRLAIISNTDDDLIAATVASIGASIDHVVTAQQAEAYKPDHRLFRHAHSVIGVGSYETVHVGMGQVTDLKVCRELGIRVVWINRLDETLAADLEPDAVLPDLCGLPELLGLP